MNPVQFKLLRMLAAVFYTPLLLLWNHGAIVDAQNYQCADGSMPYGERCFQLYEYSAVTWAEANTSCVASNGWLASILDSGTNAFISTMNFSTSSSAIWIGLNDISIEGSYRWSYGDTSNYFNWTRGRPNTISPNDDDCVIFNTVTFQWADTLCSNNYTYLCSTSAYLVSTSPSAAPSTPECVVNQDIYGICKYRDGYNVESCNWDFGDCCPGTCTGPYCGCLDTTDCYYDQYIHCYDPSQVCLFSSQLGNGICDDDANTPQCNYDGGDCCASSCIGPNCVNETYAGCIDPSETCSLSGNRFCDAATNTERCNWDGGDCCPETCPNCEFSTFHHCKNPVYSLDPSISVPCNVQYPFYLGDGYCDGPDYNNPECDWDGGDCCAGTCTGPYCGCLHSMEPNCYDKIFDECLDPSQHCEFFELVGNGHCDGDANVYQCHYDGGDCCEGSCVGPDCGCFETGCSVPNFDNCIDPKQTCYGIGNGVCSAETNIENCAWDGGDCCLESCYNCYGSVEMVCLDPQYSGPVVPPTQSLTPYTELLVVHDPVFLSINPYFVFVFEVFMTPQDILNYVESTVYVNRCGDLETTPAQVSPSVFYFYSNSTSETLTGSFVIESGEGCYNLYVQSVHHFDTTSEGYVYSTSGFTVNVVNTTNYYPNPPLLTSAMVSHDGKFVNMLFNDDTDLGGFLSSFPCLQIGMLYFAPNSTCYFSSHRTLVAILNFTNGAIDVTPPYRRNLIDVTSAVMVPQEVYLGSFELYSDKVKHRCYPEVSCVNFVYSPSTSVFLQTPENPDPPLPSLTAQGDSVLTCENLVLDPTYSKGDMGTEWKAVVWEVTGHPNASAMTDYLMNHYASNTDSIAVVPKEYYFSGGRIYVTLTLTNYLGASASVAINLRVVNNVEELPRVVILGGSSHSILTKDSFSLYAQYETTVCGGTVVSNNTNIAFTWGVFLQDLIQPIHTVSKNPRRFLSNPYIFAPKLIYTIVVTARDPRTGTSTSSSVSLKVKSAGVVAQIAEGNVFVVSGSDSFTIDASYSADLDIPNGALLYQLTCSEASPMYGRACPAGDVAFTYPIYEFQGSDFLINGVSERKLMFTLTVYRQSDTSVSSTFMSYITVLRAPSAALATFNFGQLKSSYDPVTDFVLKCSISSPVPFFAVWSVAEVNIAPAITTPINKTFPCCTHDYWLSISVGLLQPGGTYTFRLDVSETHDNPTSVKGFAIVMVRMHIPPSGGVLIANPSSGVALQTIFELSTKQWVIDVDGYPVRYTYEYYVLSEYDGNMACASSLATRCLTTLGSGYAASNYQVSCVVSVVDAISSSSTAITVVNVQPFPGNFTDLLNFTNASLNYAFSIYNSDQVAQIIKAAADTLNAEDCNAAPDCTALHRIPCSNVPNTCGECVEGYVGIQGYGNTMCHLQSEIQAVGDYCLNDSECISGNCDVTTSLCAAAKMQCPDNCNGNGTCFYYDINGNEVDSCISSDLYCSPKCTCNPGFNGSSCSMTTNEADEKAQLLDLLCFNHKKVAELEDNDPVFLIRRAKAISSLMFDFTGDQDSFLECFDSYVDALNFTDISFLGLTSSQIDRYMTTLVNGFSRASSTAKKLNLESTMVQIEQSILQLVKALTSDSVVGSAPRIILSDMIKFTTALIYSFDVSGSSLYGPMSTSDSMNNVPSDMMTFSNDLEDFLHAGLTFIQYFNNPKGVPANYSAVQFYSNYYGSGSNNPSTRRRRMQQIDSSERRFLRTRRSLATQNVLRNLSFTVHQLQPIHLNATEIVSGTVSCNVSNSPYVVPVNCSFAGQPMFFNITCPGLQQFEVEYSCPGLVAAQICMSWSGSSYDQDMSCVSSAHGETNITCACSFIEQLYGSDGLQINDFVKDLTASVELVSMSFLSRWTLLDSLTLSSIKKNMVVFAVNLILLVFLVLGFLAFFHFDMTAFVYETQTSDVKDLKMSRSIAEFFADVIPPQFEASQWYERYWGTLTDEHCILSIFNKQSVNDFRCLKWVDFVGKMIAFIFVDTILAVLFFADDGTCETHRTPSKCESQLSLDLQEYICAWDFESQSCSYRQPSQDFIPSIVLAMVITILCIPVEFLMNFLLFNCRIVLFHYCSILKQKFEASRSSMRRSMSFHEKSTRGMSELRNSMTWSSILMLGARFLKLQQTIDTKTPQNETLYLTVNIVSAITGVSQKVVHSYIDDITSSTIWNYCHEMYISAARTIGGKDYFSSMNIRTTELHRNAITQLSGEDDDAEMSIDDIDKAAVLYRILLRDVLHARKSAKQIRHNAMGIKKKDDREIFLMRKFIVHSISGVRRRVASRYFFDGMDEVEESEEGDIKATWINILWAAVVPMLLIAMCLYIFLFGVSIGPRATNAWLLGSGISLLESIFILEPLSIYFYHVLIASVTYKEVVNISNRMSKRTKYFLRRVKNQMPRSVCLIQHFNPACRAARWMPELPISRLLISLNDFDFPQDQSTRKPSCEKAAFAFAFSSVVGLQTILLLIFTSLPDILQSNLMDMFISAGFNFVLLGLYIFGIVSGVAGPIVLIALLVGVLVLYVFIVTGTLEEKCLNRKETSDVESGVEKSNSDDNMKSIEGNSVEPTPVSESANIERRPLGPGRLMSLRSLGKSQHWMMSSARWKSARFDFSYIIVRFAGGFVRNIPDAAGKSVKRFKLDEVIIIRSAVFDASSRLWLECSDGWLAALTEGGNRVLVPGNTSVPIAARTISTTLVPSEGTAWLAVDDLDLEIELELEFSTGGTNRVLRTYSDFLDLYEVLLKNHSSKNSGHSMRRLQVHSFMKFESLDEAGVLKFVEFLDNWLGEYLCQVDIPFSVISEFIRPTGRDIELMENELLGSNAEPSTAQVTQTASINSPSLVPNSASMTISTTGRESAHI